MNVIKRRAERIGQKERTRQNLLSAARALVEEGETLTIARAAERANLAEATAYRYYRNPRSVNAGEILQRLAGVKVQHRDKQEGPRYRGPSCLSRFIPEGQRPTAVLIGLGVTGAWSERA